MTAKLYVVHGSHPCATVMKALEMKGIAYKIFELTPPTHAPFMRMRFGDRTVPGIKFDDGEKVQGSRAILRRLDALVPDPALYGSAEIEEAERWGDEVLQPLVRRLLWSAFRRHPRAMHSFQQGQKLPKLPMPAVLAAAPLITRAELRMNEASDATVGPDLAALAGHLDMVDAWIADGTLGGEQPNAADLQIATSLRLLYTVGDARLVLEGRPAAEFAHRWFEPLPGSVPAGVLTPA